MRLGGRRTTARAATALLTATAVLAARGALAQKPPPTPASLPARSATVSLDKGVVRISFSYRDAVDAEIQKKLLSGLPTIITLRAYVFREGGSAPVALAAKSCRIVYDLWDEVFRIQLLQPGGAQNPVAVNVEGVLRNCGESRRMILAERSLFRGAGRYFVAALVEVNPVSAEMLDRIKRWVSRPTGSSAIGPGDSLFGSFVGLFVARIDDADRKLAFRTQSFSPPAPPPE